MFPDWETQETSVLVRSCKSPVVIVSIAIAVLSLLEAPYVSVAQQFSDKLLHSAGYMLLAVCAVWAIADAPMQRGVKYLLSGAYVVLFGGLIELLQACCTETRSGEWLDLAADAVGALVGLGIVYEVGVILRRYDI